jgi:HAE1 family hydrophobic/amphiphilic exporter-1
MFIASVVATYAMFVIMPQDFLPADDTGVVQIQVQAANALLRAHGRVRQAGRRYRERRPEHEGRDVPVQSSGAGSNGAQVRAMLKPHKDRKMSAEQIARDLRRKVSGITGINVFVTNPPALRIGGRNSRSSYQYTLQGVDLDQLQRVATELETSSS